MLVSTAMLSACGLTSTIEEETTPVVSDPVVSSEQVIIDDSTNVENMIVEETLDTELEPVITEKTFSDHPLYGASFETYVSDMMLYTTQEPEDLVLVREVPGVVSPCLIVTEGPCGLDLGIWASADWESKGSEIQTFYFTTTAGGPLGYYGPFEDDLSRIYQESFTKS